MNAVDTNVLVRYVVDDDPAQCTAARHLIDDLCSPDDPALVGPVVLAEFTWVLGYSYRFAKAQIVDALDRLGQNAHLAFDSRTEFLAALDGYRDRAIDFADCLIAARANSLSAGSVFTFDEKAARQPPFQLLATGP